MVGRIAMVEFFPQMGSEDGAERKKVVGMGSAPNDISGPLHGGQTTRQLKVDSATL